MHVLDHFNDFHICPKCCSRLLGYHPPIKRIKKAAISNSSWAIIVIEYLRHLALRPSLLASLLMR